MHIQKFTFNYFSENTYLLIDATLECAIVDPGCCNKEEEILLAEYISTNGLKPVLLLNTHAHIDHILGNAFVAHLYKLPLQMHRNELEILQSGSRIAEMYNIPYNPSPIPEVFLNEGDLITIGSSTLEIILTPGHSPGSICFINSKEQWVIGGDVLFERSIGRTDLPGGNFDTLATSIRTKLYTLPDTFTVYPGHGNETKIGDEKMNNPFVK